MSGQVKQMKDVIATNRIVVIALVGLLLFAVGIYWAIVIQRDQMGTLRSDTSGPAVHAGQQEIGIVYQPMFAPKALSDEEIAREKGVIESFGWADADHKHVRVPIEKAIELEARRGEW